MPPPLYGLLVADGAGLGQDHQSKQRGDFALAVALCTASLVESSFAGSRVRCLAN